MRRHSCKPVPYKAAICTAPDGPAPDGPAGLTLLHPEDTERTGVPESGKHYREDRRLNEGSLQWLKLINRSAHHISVNISNQGTVGTSQHIDLKDDPRVV